MLFLNLPPTQVVVYHRKKGGTVFAHPTKFVSGDICINLMLNFLLRWVVQTYQSTSY